jgi:hypothetical protein
MVGTVKMLPIQEKITNDESEGKDVALDCNHCISPWFFVLYLTSQQLGSIIVFNFFDSNQRACPSFINEFGQAKIRPFHRNLIAVVRVDGN